MSDREAYRLLTREDMEVQPGKENTLTPCRVYRESCLTEAGYYDGIYVEKGEPYFPHYYKDGFLAGDGELLFPMPDWLKEIPEEERRVRPSRVIDGIPYYGHLGLDEDFALLPFEAEGKWGYFDYRSDMVEVLPQFGFCDSFLYYSEPVRFNLDSDFLHSDADFDEDISPNHRDIPNGRWGTVEYDYGVMLVIEPVYQYLSRCHEGVMIAKKDGRWGMINGYGSELTPFAWDDMWLDWIYGAIGKKNTEQGPRYAIIDRTGRVLIDGLPGFPQLLPYDEDRDDDEDWEISGGAYCGRYFRDGDKYGVLRCTLRWVNGFQEDAGSRVEIAAAPTLTLEEAKALIRKLGNTNEHIHLRDDEDDEEIEDSDDGC